MPFDQSVARNFRETPYHSFNIEDIKALESDWLTDRVIAFWEEFLGRESLSQYPRSRIVLLRPVVSHLLVRTTDLEKGASALPDFRNATHIFLPISDSSYHGNADSGYHWSLIIVSIVDRLALHYGSLGSSNGRTARRAVGQLGLVLNVTFDFHQVEDMPQQENSKDCGVFVCMLMHHLIFKRLLKTGPTEIVSMSMSGKMIDIRGGRKEMLRVVKALRKEGKRRRSANPFAGLSNDPPYIG
ncbi:hypothetical protein C8A05DRAFT_43599 [Staphylotrichum tortipilum]|uniref:Ubiquitin-like protease family profile domain-containing protein n=1 Tax=Staphylotrichum tortipilum TaxID=2831512 RepID=A0AAN6MNC9_9PEZI|nr:hypothetical protein C8A05DRAFT_43599 [Staphylotrichum longicolle]